MKSFYRKWSLASLVLLSSLLQLPSAAQNANTPKGAAVSVNQCQKLKTQRDEMKRQYDKLSATPTAEDQLKEFDVQLEELLEVLNNTSKDTNTTVKQIRKLADGLGETGLAGPLKKVAKGLSGSAKQLVLLKNVVEKYHEYVHLAVESYDVAERGSAADQIRDFQKFFDKLRKDTPGVGEIPGLDALFSAYSESLGRIADSVDKFEALNKERLKVPEDLGGPPTLERKPKNERERRADMLGAMAKQLARLDQQILEEGCDTPTIAVDPCARVTRDIEQAKNIVDRSEAAVNLKHVEEALQTALYTAIYGKDPEQQRQANAGYQALDAQRKALAEKKERQLEDLMKMASQSWSEAEKSCYGKRTESAVAQPAKTNSCGSWLPEGWVSGPSDLPSVGHLPPQSFEFTTGTPGTPGYLHARLVVTPGVHCSHGEIGFPIYGDNNADYYKIEPIDSVPPVKTDVESYAPYAAKEDTRIFYDVGDVVKTLESQWSAPVPAGATRVIRVEMDFNFSGTKTTLKWQR